jgi:hypothetical protein
MAGCRVGAWAPPLAFAAGGFGQLVAVDADAWLSVPAAHRDRRGLLARAAFAVTARVVPAAADLANRTAVLVVPGRRLGLAAGSAGSGELPGAAPLAPKVGTDLSVTEGTWNPATTIKIQWYANGKAIVHAHRRHPEAHRGTQGQDDQRGRHREQAGLRDGDRNPQGGQESRSWTRRARASSSTSAAMRSMTARTRARSTATTARSGQTAAGRRLTAGG